MNHNEAYPVKPKRAHASYEVPVYTKVPVYPNEAYCVPNARPNVPKMNHNEAYAVCQTTTNPSKKVFGGKGSVVNGQTNAGSKQPKSVKVYPNEAYAVPNGHSTTTTKGNKKSQQKRVFGVSSGAPVVGQKVSKCVKVQVSKTQKTKENIYNYLCRVGTIHYKLRECMRLLKAEGFSFQCVIIHFPA